MTSNRVAVALIVLAAAMARADVQVVQLRLSVDTHSVLNRADDGSADRVIFRGESARVELALTGAAMPSARRGEMPGLRVGDAWPADVEWSLTADDGAASRGPTPRFEREVVRARRHGVIATGERVVAAYRLPPLDPGTYRLAARVADVSSNSVRFVVSDGTESVPLRTTYAWVQSARETNPVVRQKWLRDLGELDPTMPSPWIDLGDAALGREEFAAAREDYVRALHAFAARRVRFAGNAELTRAIDRESAHYARVVSALESAASSGGRLVVKLQHERGKKYVVMDRRSNRAVATVE